MHGLEQPAFPAGSESRRTRDVLDRRAEVLQHIASYDISFIEAATGMGKSTLLPQFVLDGSPQNVVWQLQPRRLATKRLAEYLAKVRPDSEVGFCLRGEQQVTAHSRLIYMTTGYFLHFALHHIHGFEKNIELASKPGDAHEAEVTDPAAAVSASMILQRGCTHLFIDEVHEASEEIELTLLLVKLLSLRGKLPFSVVVLSATLDFTTLHEYFLTQPQKVLSWCLTKSKFASVTDVVMMGNIDVPGWSMDDAHFYGFKFKASTVETDLKLGLRLIATDGFWKVQDVLKDGIAFDHLKIDDIIIAINGISAGTLDRQGLKVNLARRPIELHLLRALPSLPTIAPVPLQLAAETPYAVEVIYLDDLEQLSAIMGQPVHGTYFNSEKHKAGIGPDLQLLGFCVRLLLRTCCTKDDCALVFLPGLAEIEHFIKELEKTMRETSLQPCLDWVVLHSVTLEETCEVKRPDILRPTAYIATSIAETSITLPELSIVFDFGFSRLSIFDASLQLEQLVTRMTSKSSARQRAGRVGRTKPGRVYRLYPRDHWDSMPDIDAWEAGSTRCLESSILLVAKTLVPVLRLELCECMMLLVRPPSETQLALGLSQLDEIDALVGNENKNYQLTAFGEFAACLSMGGPRMARLVYCGVLFRCVRSAIALTALHIICSRFDLFAMPPDLRFSVNVTDGQAADADSRNEERAQHSQQVQLNESGPLGLRITRSTASKWVLSHVKEGSWAEAQGLQVDDELVSLNGSPTLGMTELQLKELLTTVRPLNLFFLRSTLLLEAEARVEQDEVLSRKSLMQLIQIAKCSAKFDDGCFSEPLIFLRALECFIERTLPYELFILHRLRQVDVLCREISTKLRSMGNAARKRYQKNWSNWNEQQSFLTRLAEDEEFWSLDYTRPLSAARCDWDSSRHFLYNCLDQSGVSDLRLVLCAAFPANFLFAVLKPQVRQFTHPELEFWLPPEEQGPQVRSAPNSTAISNESESVQDASQSKPIMILDAVLSTVSSEELAQRIAHTFSTRPPILTQMGETSTFQVEFQWDYGEWTWNTPRIADLSSAATANMLAQRDPKQRLWLLQVNDEANPSPCGQLLLSHTWEWRVLRLPHLTVKTLPRLTPLSKAGPIQGVGPDIPGAGHGSSGFRLAISVDLDISRLSQQEGRKFRGGKGVRNWLTSWLPNVNGTDLAMLLCLWPKGFTLHEDLSSIQKQSRYAAITLGTGLTICFHTSQPFTAEKLSWLSKRFLRIKTALRTGLFVVSELPSNEELSNWAGEHLSRVKVSTEPWPSAPEACQFTHAAGFVTVHLKTFPPKLISPAGSNSPKVKFDMPKACDTNFSRPPFAPGRHLEPFWKQYWLDAVCSASCPQQSHACFSDSNPPSFSTECVVRLPGSSRMEV